MLTAWKRFLSVILMLLVLIALVSCQAESPVDSAITDTTLPEITDTAATEPTPALPDGIVLAGAHIETACTVDMGVDESRGDIGVFEIYYLKIFFFS